MALANFELMNLLYTYQDSINEVITQTNKGLNFITINDKKTNDECTDLEKELGNFNLEIRKLDAIFGCINDLLSYYGMKLTEEGIIIINTFEIKQTKADIDKLENCKKKHESEIISNIFKNQ